MPGDTWTDVIRRVTLGGIAHNLPFDVRLQPTEVYCLDCGSNDWTTKSDGTRICRACGWMYNPDPDSERP